jgi:hypothetical protein
MIVDEKLLLNSLLRLSGTVEIDNQVHSYYFEPIKVEIFVYTYIKNIHIYVYV